MVPNRSSMAVLGMVALIALSGCITGGQLSAEQEKQVVKQFEERMDEIDTFTATMESETTFNGDTHEVSAEITVRPKTGEMRQKLLAPEENAGNVYVTNETHMVRYDADANEYTVTELNGDTFDRDLSSQLTDQLETHDVYYNGTDTVRGQQAHKVTLVPNESADTYAAGTTTVWVDDEKMFPVKMVTETDNEDITMNSTVTYSDVELNPELDEAPFTFDPPADAEKAENTGPDIAEYESIDELDQDTNVSVPNPDLPEDFEFSDGSVFDHKNVTTVSADYTDGDNRVSVSLRAGGEVHSNEESETVELDKQTGQYQEYGDSGVVSWECSDDVYAVAGDLDKSELTDIAASLECA